MIRHQKNATQLLSTFPKLIVVLGPTAIGKSDLAVEIGRKYNGEVISADSRQIYTGLDIATGKITRKEMRDVPHHCLNIVSPRRKKLFSVSEFQKCAEGAITDILNRGKVPILCGGTGFYIDAVIDGVILPEVEPDLKLRKKLNTYSTERLGTLLKKLDSARYAQIDIQNPVRVIRAIEIAKAIGRVPVLEKVKKYHPIVIGLDTDDECLKEKIRTRIKKRITQGMYTEAKELHEGGVTWKRMREFGLEYGLLADVLENKITKEQFKEQLFLRTWQYVKRQRSWFKRRDDIHWFTLSKINILKNKDIKKPLLDVISKGLRNLIVF
jgi:tRNA dimethylallyltransferase